MSTKTKSQILTEASVIKNETTGGANTADRVGTALYDLGENYVHSDDLPDMSNYQTTAAAAQETQRVNQALANTASAAALASLTSTVSTKAAQSAVTTLENAVLIPVPIATDVVDVDFSDSGDCLVILTGAAISVVETFTGSRRRARFFITCRDDVRLVLQSHDYGLTSGSSYILYIFEGEDGNIYEFLTTCE